MPVQCGVPMIDQSVKATKNPNRIGSTLNRKKGTVKNDTKR